MKSSPSNPYCSNADIFHTFCRFVDPHHFNADPDPNQDTTFHFNANPDPDQDPHQNDDANLRPLFSTVPQNLHGFILRLNASIMSVNGPPRLHFEPLYLLNFDFNADPDPVFHSNEDPNP